MKILSYNVRGLGAVEKRIELQRLIAERRVDVLCIQESKMEVVEESLIRYLWGSDSVNFSFIPSIGASGGIITIWDPCVLNVWSSIVKMHCLIVIGQFIEDNVDFFLANVYAPCESTGRVNLWNGLDGFLQQHRQMAGCVLGDFNTVRSQEERRRRQVSGSSEDLTPFNLFM
jgi:exonuclease III